MACREELSRSHSRGNKTMSKEIVHDPQAISKQILELGSNLPECKPHIWRGLHRTIQKQIQMGYDNGHGLRPAQSHFSQRNSRIMPSLSDLLIRYLSKPIYE